MAKLEVNWTKTPRCDSKVSSPNPSHQHLSFPQLPSALVLLTEDFVEGFVEDFVEDYPWTIPIKGNLLKGFLFHLGR